MSSAASTFLPSAFLLNYSSAYIERMERESVLPEVAIATESQNTISNLSSATYSDIESNIDDIIAEINRHREKIKQRFAVCLQEAREEAQDQLDLVPLTNEAEGACRDFGNWVADQYFYKRYLKLIATAKLNGGAAFVAVHQTTGRRIDISFEPDGLLASIFMTDRKHRVIRENFQKDSKSWDRYIQWLFIEKMPSAS
jgi:hypothetical protein